MKKIILFLVIAMTPLSAAGPDFNRLQQLWGKTDSVSVNKTGEYKYTVTVKSGSLQAGRDLYMIMPKNPEFLLWFFHGYKPAGDPYKQSPDIFIDKYDLKKISSWYNAIIVIVDSGTSLYSYTSDGIPELKIYSSIYEKLFRQYPIPVILAGVSSGAEGAVKFAPFIKNVKSVIGISGTYNFDSLDKDSGEYKIHLKEYGSRADWRYEQPVKIFPALNCRIILLSEENSIYRAQASQTSAEFKNIRFIESAGKGASHNWDFWASDDVKKIIADEIQSVD